MTHRDLGETHHFRVILTYTIPYICILRVIANEDSNIANWDINTYMDIMGFMTKSIYFNQKKFIDTGTRFKTSMQSPQRLNMPRKLGF